jgi:hypothetical protein
MADAAEPEPEPEPTVEEAEVAVEEEVDAAAAGGKHGPIMRRRLKKFLSIVDTDEGWECVLRQRAVPIKSCVCCDRRVHIRPLCVRAQGSWRADIQRAQRTGRETAALGTSR